MRLAGLEVLSVEAIEVRIEQRKAAQHNALDEENFKNQYALSMDVEDDGAEVNPLTRASRR